MNAKQIIPVIAKIAPPLLLGVVIFLALKELFSAQKDTETKPETAPANTETETALKTPAFRPIPAEIPVKAAVVPIHSAPAPFFPPAVAPVPAVIPPFSVLSVPKVSAPVPAPRKIAAQIPPPPIKKKFVTREDLATVFHRGARALTRTAAVAALKNLGFGKTAAYAALSPNGRFSAWLQCAPDGIITWNGRPSENTVNAS
jgi:hypothetical protein